jgi:hypothetical protein
MDGGFGQAIDKDTAPRRVKLDAHGRWLFEPGDKVQRLARHDRDTVWTVKAIEGDRVVCEFTHAMGPDREATQSERFGNWELTPVRSLPPIPTIKPIIADVAELSAVTLLQLSTDGGISDAQWAEARRKDKETAARRNERLAALLAEDGAQAGSR